MNWSLLRSVGSLLGRSAMTPGLPNAASNVQIFRPLSTILLNSSSLLNPSWTSVPMESTRTPMMPPNFVQVRGMKVRASLQKRCKDCTLIYIKGLLYNLCNTHGRHRQRHKPKYFVNMRILSGVSTAIKKPW